MNYKRFELNSKTMKKKKIIPLPIENGECKVPYGVTTIGIGCFKGCSTLTNVQLPSTLLNMRNDAFSNTNISVIMIPDRVTSIGNECFSGCSTLTNIQLPSSLISIGEWCIRKYKYFNNHNT